MPSPFPPPPALRGTHTNKLLPPLALTVVLSVESESQRWPWIYMSLIVASLSINKWSGGMCEITSSSRVGFITLKFPISMRASLFMLVWREPRQNALLLRLLTNLYSWIEIYMFSILYLVLSQNYHGVDKLYRESVDVIIRSCHWARGPQPFRTTSTWWQW